jgi:transposase InsO family protein
LTLSLYADRCNLAHLLHQYPHWSAPQLAHTLERSTSWVKKWRARLMPVLDSPEALREVCVGLSRARKHPPPRLNPLVEQSILAIRDQPPEGLRRTPGPRAIQYYLPRDPALQLFSLARPPSTRTIYEVLKRNQRIPEHKTPDPQPMERPAPLSHWQLDFKDVSSASAEPDGKQQHVLETCNAVDMGTSLLLSAEVCPDFTAETTLRAVAEAFRTHGLPEAVTVDRDPRWVGSPQGSDFPSAFLRFCQCVGVQVQVCDPHHPQQNAFVERYHRTYQSECLALDRPQTLSQAREATARFQIHYNQQRPNQARSCANRPPLQAFPHLPTLPSVPAQVDPDAWLTHWEGKHFQRKVDASGAIRLDLKHYAVGKQWKGQRVTVRIDAAAREVQIFHEAHLLKTHPLKGVVGRLLSFEDCVEHMARQARAQHRLRTWQERRFRTAAQATA